MMTLKKAISTTLTYADKYQCSLTKEELSFRLISETDYGIENTINYLYTHNYEQNSVLSKNKINYQNKINRAIALSDHLKSLKNILFIGVTGSVAAGYPAKTDDIDLMIITKNDTLWLTRFQIKLFLLTHHIAHRKAGKQEVSNQFCLNLWLDERALMLPKNKQNLKNSVDLILIRPILNRNKTYEKFILSNLWAKKYVQQGLNKIIQKFDEKPENHNILENKALSIINLILYKLQYLYMSKKICKELVDIHRAFFHPEG